MEIIPKTQPSLKLSFLKNLFVDLLFLIFLIIVGLSIFFFFRERTLLKEKGELESKLLVPETEKEQEIESEMTLWKDRLDLLEKLLNEHLFPSKFFAFLEERTLKKVQLKGLQLKPKEKEVALSFITDSFDNFVKQVLLFQSEKEIHNLSIEKIEISPEGKIQFNISFSINEKIMKP